MSKYTTQLRFVCETLAGLSDSVGLTNTADTIEKARPLLFDFDFPIYDESYRSVLETKIIRHYYTREIGAETVGLFKFWLETKLNEIMPYYNKLYETAVLEFNPLYNFEYWKTGSKDGSGDTSSTVENTTDTEQETTSEETYNNEGWNKFSDTPQGSVQNLDNDTYLTNATKTTDDSTHTGSGTLSGNITSSGNTEGAYTNTEEYAEHVYGKNSSESYAKLIAEFRKNILNIDMMIIDELADLFFLLW